MKYFHSCSPTTKRNLLMARPLIILTCMSCHCLIHKLTALFSPAHLLFSINFLYKPSFSIPQPYGIASFFHLISNFLTSHPLLSEKRSFLEILLHFLSQAEYCPTSCLDAARDEIKTRTFVYRLDTSGEIQHRKLSKFMPMH